MFWISHSGLSFPDSFFYKDRRRAGHQIKVEYSLIAFRWVDVADYEVTICLLQGAQIWVMVCNCRRKFKKGALIRKFRERKHKCPQIIDRIYRRVGPTLQSGLEIKVCSING